MHLCFRAVSAFWLNGSSYFTRDVASRSCCPDGHVAKQLKQWRQCTQVIREYEHSLGADFKVVIKLRPDDLWFGAMKPHCVLRPDRVVYSSKTSEDLMSDQWLTFPRRAVEPIMNTLQQQLIYSCNPDFNFSGVRDSTDYKRFKFERSVERVIGLHQKAFKYTVSVSKQPRILARPDPKYTNSQPGSVKEDVKVKCAMFLKFVNTQLCVNISYGALNSTF